MPTYAYTCTVCGHSFDVHQSFDDAPLTVCPECSGRLRKVFSPVGVVFKGSGFYRTDARSSSSGRSSEKAAAPAATSGSASSSTTPAPAATSAPAAAKPAAKAAES